MDSLITKEQYAIWVDKSLSTVRAWVNQGRLRTQNDPITGKEMIRLANHRIEFYQMKKR